MSKWINLGTNINLKRIPMRIKYTGCRCLVAVQPFSEKGQISNSNYSRFSIFHAESLLYKALWSYCWLTQQHSYILQSPLHHSLYVNKSKAHMAYYEFFPVGHIYPEQNSTLSWDLQCGIPHRKHVQSFPSSFPSKSPLGRPWDNYQPRHQWYPENLNLPNCHPCFSSSGGGNLTRPFSTTNLFSLVCFFYLFLVFNT